VKPIRTDFKGYEGKYVATDPRTGQVVIADEPIYVGLDPLALPLPGGPPADAPGQPVFRPFMPVSLAANNASAPNALSRSL
jgi:hypothetical protein